MRTILLWSIFILLICSQFKTNAQVGINILYPDTSAILHLESTDRGLLFPRMTTTQRDAIPLPKAGLMIYNNQDSLMQYYNGECWLQVFQKSCDDCFFEAEMSDVAGTIDRVVEDSISITIDITQNNGNPQNIALAIANMLPPGVTYSISPNPQFSTGTVTVTFYATPFAPDGTFPIVLQVLCGGQIMNLIYSLTLTPCHEVTVYNSVDNYDLASELYLQDPTLSASIPVCVVSYVNTGVTISSPSTGNVAYTTGNLHPNSVVALVNNGNIIGKGGDGGIAWDPVQGWDGTGQDGGTAVVLTADTDIVNNFNIYGGGGGGASMAFSITFPIPIININIGFLIGSGGGGGAGGGTGGDIPTIIGFSFYGPGVDGTSGQFGIPGDGGILTAPIDFNVGVATITLTPNTVGGNGGDYGSPGTQGTFQLSLSATVIVFGFPVNVIQNVNIPIPVPAPTPGNGGFAIKKNGNDCNIPDNLYNNSNLRGEVGN